MDVSGKAVIQDSITQCRTPFTQLLFSYFCVHALQLMLRHEPDLVEGAARLIREVLAPSHLPTPPHTSSPPSSTPLPPSTCSPLPVPPALSRLYLTGALYFALAYTGSNLEEVAALLRATHLRQAFRSAVGICVRVRGEAALAMSLSL